MNLWDRHQNKRALEKKKRTKSRSFEGGAMGRTTEMVGQVVHVERQDYIVRQNNTNEPYSKESGLESPVVGDEVYLEGDKIVGIKERISFLIRFRKDASRRSGVGAQHVVAANIHRAIIVAAVTMPEFHPRFIDRYLIACQQGNVEPVICLTKTDLTDKRPVSLDIYKKLGIPIIETSVTNEEGIDALREAIANRVVVFVGASGVGKSSLVNAILHGEVAETGAVGEKTERGRHTTTGSQMYLWMKDSYIIDTPGIRSLGLDHLDKQEIEYYFLEFAPYRTQCKFENCLHMHEPECAVKKAVAEGDISLERYESYLRLVGE